VGSFVEAPNSQCTCAELVPTLFLWAPIPMRTKNVTMIVLLNVLEGGAWRVVKQVVFKELVMETISISMKYLL